MIFRKILCAFDGSEASRKALDYAADIANECKGEIIILTVVPKVTLPVFPDEGLGSAPISAAQDLGEYQDRMRAVYKKAQEDAEKALAENFKSLKATSVFVEGRPSAVIVEHAEKNDVDLIVIGSRGLGGISGWILGSTSRRVAESCTKPILILK